MVPRSGIDCRYTGVESVKDLPIDQTEHQPIRSSDDFLAGGFLAADYGAVQ